MSESENSFFRKYNNRNANLLTFLMHFESAIDAQRDGHDKLSSVDESSIPKVSNACLFERHAASVYTTQILLKVQKEIWCAGSECSISNIIHGTPLSTYVIVDSFFEREFKIEVNISDENFVCECNHFLRHGLLCRHIYVVLQNLKVRRIPDKYILPRWRRYACSEDLVSNIGKSNECQLDKIHLLNMLQLSSTRCIGLVGGDVDKMKEMLQDFNDLVDKYKPEGDNDIDKSSKQKAFENYYGASIPSIVHMKSPDAVSTKGSGRRLKSRKERAIRDANKPKRRCSKCKAMTNHDARNCPKAE